MTVSEQLDTATARIKAKEMTKEQVDFEAFMTSTRAPYFLRMAKDSLGGYKNYITNLFYVSWLQGVQGKPFAELKETVLAEKDFSVDKRDYFTYEGNSTQRLYWCYQSAVAATTGKYVFEDLREVK